jgi:hypothetical protein
MVRKNAYVPKKSSQQAGLHADAQRAGSNEIGVVDRRIPGQRTPSPEYVSLVSGQPSRTGTFIC